MQISFDSLLASCGLRRSKDRMTILHLFQEKRTWTAAQLINWLPMTDLSTVYRNLTALEKHKLIRSVHGHGKKVEYEWADRKHHEHRLCEKCKASYCIPCPLKTKTKHHLEFFETCKACPVL